MDFFRTYIAPRSISLATETLKQGWVSEGRLVGQFERGLSEKLGLANPVAVNSGTSALHLALAVAGVGPGDEVILPAQTFVATGLAILMQGAKPVFADINPWTGNICVDSLRAKTNERTRAVMPVHYGGYPCDLREINDFANRMGLCVIEDAAHALGAMYEGAPIGSHSRFCVFSFQAIKHLTTGDGGALCALRAVDSNACRQRRWFGIDRQKDLPNSLGEREYSLTDVGFKYHMNDIAAAIGIGNLEEFPQRLARRKSIAARYDEAFQEVKGLFPLRFDKTRGHAYWLYTVRVERRNDFVKALKAAGVPTSVVHRRIDHHPVFGGQCSLLPGQEVFDEEQISLPVHDGLSDAEVEAVIAAVRRGW